MTDPLTHAREIVGGMTPGPIAYCDGALDDPHSAARWDIHVPHKNSVAYAYHERDAAGIVLAVSTLRRLTDPQAPERLARVIDPAAWGWFDQPDERAPTTAAIFARDRQSSLAKATEYINALLTEG